MSDQHLARFHQPASAGNNGIGHVFVVDVEPDGCAVRPVAGKEILIPIDLHRINTGGNVGNNSGLRFGRNCRFG